MFPSARCGGCRPSIDTNRALRSWADATDSTSCARLLAEAADHLAPGGLLVVEIGDGRAALERAFPRLPFTWRATQTSGGAVFLLERSELPYRA